MYYTATKSEVWIFAAKNLNGEKLHAITRVFQQKKEVKFEFRAKKIEWYFLL